jgi:hypothetical protein
MRVFRYAGTCVGHGYVEVPVDRGRSDAHLASVRKLDRVADKVEDLSAALILLYDALSCRSLATATVIAIAR